MVADDSALAGIDPSLDLVLRGGRVIDPESGHDGVADVGIAGGRIVALGEVLPPAPTVIDCAGLVVCPGFIDLHSHAQSLVGSRLQALDGVTTAMDLECGVVQTPRWHGHVATEGRPINFGFSASWALARGRALGVADPSSAASTPFAAFQTLTQQGAWKGQVTPARRAQVIDVLESEIHAGAIGIGALLGYHPDASAGEVTGVAEAASRLRTTLFVHSRSSARSGPVNALTSVDELVAAAEETGAHVHICHLNSTSSTWLPEVIATIEGARERGVRITTEVYPYSRGSTVLGAAFLTVEELEREGRGPSSLTYLPTGESIADAARLNHLRAADPTALVLTTTYDEADPAERALFDLALSVPHAAFASDAMPMFPDVLDDIWPPPLSAATHPRGAGCFGKVLRWLVRERGLLTLTEAIGRCTLVPADIAADAAPALRWKGRVQPGADADLVAFDAEVVADRADYTTLEPSRGVQHLLVGGIPVIRGGSLLPEVRPGRPVTSQGIPNRPLPRAGDVPVGTVML